MSLRGALRAVARLQRDDRIETSAPDLTAAALAQDVSRARDQVEAARRRLEHAERELGQRRWELETYALHGIVPKRKGLARRIAEMAAEARKRALHVGPVTLFDAKEPKR